MRLWLPALLLLVPVLAWATEPVPVTNASFEEAAAQAEGPAAPDWETGGAPPGWHHWIGETARPGNPVLTWETTGGRTGDRCVSLAGCIGPVCVIQSVPIEPGGSYRVRAWAKTSKPGSGCYFSVRWQDADGKWVGGSGVRVDLPGEAAADEWHLLELPATAPADAGRLVILLTADEQTDADTCWFDDVSVDAFGPEDILIAACSWMPKLLYPEGDPPTTPYTPWARPWAKGTTRVLFVLGHDHSLREHIELAQRMDIEYDYTFAHEHEPSLYALDHNKVQKRLDEGYYDCAVIALSADENLCRAFMDRLGTDGGVVFVAGGPSKPKPPADVAFSSAPEEHWLRGSVAAMPRMGEARKTALGGIEIAEGTPGRAVRVSWTQGFRCLTPTHSYDEYLATGAGYWEGYLQTLARAILWAAHREPEQPAELTATAAGATLTVPVGARTARTWVTDRLNRTVAEQTVPGTHGAIELSTPDEAASGPTMFSAVVTDAGGRALDFASCLVDEPIASGIVSVRPEKPHFVPGEEIGVTVEIAGEQQGTLLQTVLTDIHGREVARAETAPTSGANAVTLTMRDHLSTLNWVTARLVRDGVEIDAARWYVLVPLPRKPFLEDFQVGTWASTGYHPAYLHDAMLEAMQRAGITEGLEGVAAYVPTLAGGVWPVSTAYGRIPGFTRFEGPDTARVPCLSDPDVREKMASAAEQVAAEERGFAPIFGYIRDETSLVRDSLAIDTCSTQACQQRYREWLKQRYDTIPALNAEWGTAYADWADVGWSDFKGAREAGNLAPWLMYRRFMDWVWAEGISFSAQSAKKADPDAMLALANSFGLAPFSGRDYWLLAQANDYTMEYPYEAWGATPWLYHFEAVRSFSPEVVHHPWIGYRHQEEALHYEPWWCALHGASGVEIYGCMSLFAGHNSWAQVFPTMQLTTRGRIYAEECEPLKRGIGKMLMNAERPQAPVAILWSQPSFYAAFGLTDSAETVGQAQARPGPYRQYAYSREAFRQAVISTGRQFDYLCEEQILEGALDGYECLMLPGSFAVGPEVCARIEQFVQAGGLLIADQGAGLLNGVGAPYADGGPLAGVLGIGRTDGRLGYETTEMAVELPWVAAMTVRLRGHEQLAPVADAPAYEDGSPIIVDRELGEGRTVFLNCVAGELPDLRGLLDGLPAFTEVVGEAGDGEPTAYEVVRLDKDDIHFYGVLRDYRIEAEAGPVRISLQEPDGRHLYSVRTGEYLGQTRTAELTIEPGGTALLASIPYAVTGVRFATIGDARRGETLRGRLTVLADATPGDHVLRVDVLRPDGTPAEAYCANLLTRAGVADLEVLFAPNDPAGAWKIVARDIISGMQMETVVRVGG